MVLREQTTLDGRKPVTDVTIPRNYKVNGFCAASTPENAAPKRRPTAAFQERADRSNAGAISTVSDDFATNKTSTISNFVIVVGKKDQRV